MREARSNAGAEKRAENPTLPRIREGSGTRRPYEG